MNYLKSFSIVGLFASLAIIAALVGSFIDNTFGITPWGTIGMFIVVNFVSWGTALVLMKQFRKTIDEADQESQENSEKK